MDQQQAVFQNILTRRSVRSYQNRPVPREVLEAVLNAGLWAPSASNRQTWHFTVITDPKTIDEINERGKQWMANSGSESHMKRAGDPNFHIFFHAPCLLLVSYRKEPEWNSNWGEVDTALAAQNIMLAAHAMGLGSCYIGWLTPWLKSEEGSALLKKLGIEEPLHPFHFITLGYPTETENRQGPKRRENTVVYL